MLQGLAAKSVQHQSLDLYGGIGAMDTEDDHDMKISLDENQLIQKPKRVSRTYAFSDRDIRKYEMYKKEGRLRFPDLFLYHINRPTDDVQREVKLQKKLDEEKSTRNNIMINDTTSTTVNTLSMEDKLSNSNNSTPSPTEGDAAVNNKENVLLGTQQQPIISKNQTSTVNEENNKLSVQNNQVTCSNVVTRCAIPAITATAGFVGTLLITSSIATSTFVAIPVAVVAFGTVECIRYVSSGRLTKSAPVTLNESNKEENNQSLSAAAAVQESNMKMETLRIST